MLVVSRKQNERVRLGDDIVITVIEIRDGIVRLGFDAPRELPIHREEVYQRIKAEEAEASGN